MKYIKNNWVKILLCIVIAILVLRECNHVPIILPGYDTHLIDTIIIEKPYIPIPIKPNNTPVKVKIFTKKDTALRKEREKEKIIENVTFKKNEVDITTIDSTGKIETDIHIIEPDSKEIVIDNTGQVEEKKRTKAHKILVKVWKGTKTGLIIVGAATIVILTATHL